MNTIQMVRVDLIDPHPNNPRRDLGPQDKLAELAESIKAQGIRQNLLLVPVPGARFHRYTAVIGHRRLAAAQLAGLTEVPAVVDEQLDAAGQLELMLLENVQRTDLSPMEEAEGYQQLLDLGVKVREIAKQTGRAEKTVTARLRLMKLPEATREKIHSHEATLEDAAELDRFVKFPKLLAKLSEAIGTHNWRWVLEEARRELTTDIARKEITTALAKLGIEHHGTDGYAYVDFRQVAQLRHASDVEKAVKDGFPEGTVWIRSYSGVELIRPTTEEERNGSAQRDEKWEAENAHREAIEAEGQAAADLRDTFLRGLMTRKLTAKQVSAILAATLPAAVAQYSSNAWAIERWAGISSKRTDELPGALRAVFPDADPACWLLVALHVAIPTTWGWESVHSKIEARTLYPVLEALGYPISDAERARLTPPADGVDDDEEADE